MTLLAPVLLLGMAPLAQSGWRPESVETLCAEVRDTANAGRLAETAVATTALTDVQTEPYRSLDSTDTWLMRAASADLDADGVAEVIGYVGSGGSCSTESIVELDQSRARGGLDHRYHGFSEADVESDEALRWAGWGTREGLFRIGGHTVLLALGREQQPVLALLFDQGRRIPLCSFETREPSKIEVLSGDEHEVCEAVSSRSVSLKEWTLNWPDTAREQAQAFFAGPADGEVGLELDLDGDGDVERLRRFTYASGAGCGHDYRWVVEVDADGAPLDSPLSTVLAPNASGRYARAEFAAFEVAMWQGLPHLIGTSTQGLGVFTLRGDSLERLCHLREWPQVDITRTYLPR